MFSDYRCIPRGFCSCGKCGTRLCPCVGTARTVPPFLCLTVHGRVHSAWRTKVSWYLWFFFEVKCTQLSFLNFHHTFMHSLKRMTYNKVEVTHLEYPVVCYWSINYHVWHFYLVKLVGLHCGCSIEITHLFVCCCVAYTLHFTCFLNKGALYILSAYLFLMQSV